MSCASTVCPRSSQLALRKKHLGQLAEIQKEMKQALAQKDEQTKKELGKVRSELQRNIKKIESDRDRLSREYAEEKARADRRMRRIREDLQAEKAARKKKRDEVAQLKREMERNCSRSARELESMRRELEDLRQQQSNDDMIFPSVFNVVGYEGGIKICVSQRY